MKILILVALILQVIIIQETDGYEFGDIIVFPRKCGSVTVYKHYAIYVGPESWDNDVGQGDNDIFHRTHKTWMNKVTCGFGKLQDTRKKSQDTVDNYLEKPGLLPEEDLPWVAALTKQEDIISRINELKNKEKCGKYALSNNNCEHLATYVRYGQCLSFQEGTAAGPLQQRLKKKKNTQALARLEERLEELRKNQEAERQCASDAVASTSSRSTIMLSAYLALLSSFLI